MKPCALSCLLLCLSTFWGALCSTSEVHQAAPDPTLGTADANDDVDSWPENCTYYHLVEHLKLDEKNAKFTLVRPVLNPDKITKVTLDVAIYAILDVGEVDQTLTSYLWTLTTWENELIRWNPDDFCGIKSVAVATSALWRPDIIIQDMIDKDKSNPSPYMTVFYNGTVEHRNDPVVVSTCRIRAFKFPFDNQTCDLSFRSAMYSDRAIHLAPLGDSNQTTEWTWESLKTQYEWFFTDITITEQKLDFFNEQDVVTYSIHIKRRYGLYVVNYILPLLFFLFLDFASFLIRDMGDKLGFKITVLLAVTVMQLLFNEILPASSDRIPLIAMYCVGIFFLMLLSLLESLVILYLLNRDEKQEQGDPYRRLKDAISLSTTLLSDSTLEKAKLLDLVLAALSELLQNKQEEVEPGYWTRKVPIINRVFIFFYFTLAALFLGTIFYFWLF